MSDGTRHSNRLLVPFIIACVACVVEAVVIAFLVGRGSAPAPIPNRTNGSSVAARSAAATEASRIPTSNPATAAAPPLPTVAAAPSGPSIVRGKLNQRVEATGFAVTVFSVNNKPAMDLLAPPASQKLVDCDVLLENTGKTGIRYYGANVKLQDDQARVFDNNAIGGGGPKLGFGTLPAGGKVRGHVAYTVSKDVKGLTLIVPAPQDQSIYVDLGR